MKVYLAGSIPKGDENAKVFRDWRREYSTVLTKIIPHFEPVDPNIFFDLEGDSLAITGADCLLIMQSDLIVINAEVKIGAGTAMEMVIAKYFKKPVITVLPKDTHHRKSNLVFNGRLISDWINPFIEAFSDIIISDIHDLGKAHKQIKTKKIKTITVIDDAIRHAETLLSK